MIAAIAAAFVCAAMSSPAHAQLRVVNYNIAQLNGDQAALAGVIDALGEDDKIGWTVPVSVYVFQEVQSGDRVPLLNLVNANAPPGVSYSQATYTTSALEDSSAGAQLLLFRTGLLTEVTTAHIDIATGSNRNCDRWQLRLLYSPGETWAPTPDAATTFYVYGMHLPANNTGADITERANAINAIRTNAAGLGAAVHIIYTGDMNLYSNTEQGYLNWIAAGTSQATDPLGTGTWGGGGANAIKLTQAPCNAGCSLVGGGMDDRFDFQLHNSQFNDFDGLQRIAGTYRSFGNDGNHFNTDINAGNNSYYPADIPRSNALADDLHVASDHIPVIVEYRLPAAMSATLDATFGTVIQGASVTVDLTVSNVSPVAVSVGADLLDYSFAGNESLGLNADGGSLAGLSAPAVHQLDVDTSVVGSGYGWVDLTSNSEGCRDAVQFLETDGTIVRPSNASFSGSSDVNSTTVPVAYDVDTGVQAINVPVHNLGFDSLQALLDIDAVSAVTPPFAYTGGAATGIGATPATLNFTFDTTATAPGLYTQNVTIDVSDQDIPGAGNGQLTLTIEVTINGSTPCLGDIAPVGNPDGEVDIDDYTDVILGWGTAGPQGDTDNDGDVDIDDFTNVILNWGCVE